MNEHTSSIASQACIYCGTIHPGLICPRIKAMEFQENGSTIKRIEFLTPMDYPPQGKVDEPEQDYPRLKGVT